MSTIFKLISRENPYDGDMDGQLFLGAVKENLQFQIENCPAYAQMLAMMGFAPEQLRTPEDVFRIPPLPTLYFKRNKIYSVDEDKLFVRATSSGTKGSKSQIGFDRRSFFNGLFMMFRFFIYHRVVSLIPTNYIVLGYELGKNTEMGAAKTAYGTTKFAPALHREYALKNNGTDYVVNIDGIKRALQRYARQPFPVRFVGFPSYLYFLVSLLKQNNISLKLSKYSKILLGGGWKQFSHEEIDREEFYGLIRDTLGIERENCLEFFSAVEHPLPYCKCRNGHFHVPIYSRVIIRDVKTLVPLPHGQEGLLSFVAPLVLGMPLLSVVTDDIAVSFAGENCGCGIKMPYFELLGRAGIAQIKTCTAQAADLIGGVGI